MVFRLFSSLLCIDFMGAVCAAHLALPIASEKSRRQTMPNLSSKMPFCQGRQLWLELMAENGRYL
jgi:hypothetical protein